MIRYSAAWLLGEWGSAAGELKPTCSSHHRRSLASLITLIADGILFLLQRGRGLRRCCCRAVSEGPFQVEGALSLTDANKDGRVYGRTCSLRARRERRKLNKRAVPSSSALAQRFVRSGLPKTMPFPHGKALQRLFRLTWHDLRRLSKSRKFMKNGYSIDEEKFAAWKNKVAPYNVKTPKRMEALRQQFMPIFCELGVPSSLAMNSLSAGC